eukprot:4019881-Pyramimonas_sp.AAC.1
MRAAALGVAGHEPLPNLGPERHLTAVALGPRSKRAPRRRRAPAPARRHGHWHGRARAQPAARATAAQRTRRGGPPG